MPPGVSLALFRFRGAASLEDSRGIRSTAEATDVLLRHSPPVLMTPSQLAHRLPS